MSNLRGPAERLDCNISWIAFQILRREPKDPQRHAFLRLGLGDTAQKPFRIAKAPKVSQECRTCSIMAAGFHRGHALAADGLREAIEAEQTSAAGY
jgi:hypothetical protein